MSIINDDMVQKDDENVAVSEREQEPVPHKTFFQFSGILLYIILHLQIASNIT